MFLYGSHSDPRIAIDTLLYHNLTSLDCIWSFGFSPKNATALHRAMAHNYIYSLKNPFHRRGIPFIGNM